MTSKGREVTTPTRPLDDPAEAVERIVSRRQLLVEDGDILLTRSSAGLSQTPYHPLYELHVRGHGPTGDRFAGFDHAVAHGEQLAVRSKVRLLYLETPDDPPHLLNDYRPMAEAAHRESPSCQHCATPLNLIDQTKRAKVYRCAGCGRSVAVSK